MGMTLIEIRCLPGQEEAWWFWRWCWMHKLQFYMLWELCVQVCLYHSILFFCIQTIISSLIIYLRQILFSFSPMSANWVKKWMHTQVIDLAHALMFLKQFPLLVWKSVKKYFVELLAWFLFVNASYRNGICISKHVVICFSVIKMPFIYRLSFL